MTKNDGRGGRRDGAGRKKTDRKPVKFYINDIEKEYLKSKLAEFRAGGQIFFGDGNRQTFETFEEKIEKMGQGLLPFNE